MKYLIIGDKPSSKNKDLNIAFVGTKSYETLLSWLSFLNININDCKIINSNNPTILLNQLCLAVQLKTHIIVLGNNAEKRVSKHVENYFKLPHPSPRNRLLNNPEYIKIILKNTKNFVV